jgi:tetrahydromethanopterin S-methyltransferase subunit G
VEASDARAAADGPQRRQDDAEMFEMQQLEAMEQPRWNEGRLDDLSRKVDDGIGRLDEERKELRKEVKEGFEKVDKRFDKVDKRFEKVADELKGLHRVIAYGAITMSGTMVVGFVSIMSQL